MRTHQSRQCSLFTVPVHGNLFVRSNAPELGDHGRRQNGLALRRNVHRCSWFAPVILLGFVLSSLHQNLNNDTESGQTAAEQDSGNAAEHCGDASRLNVAPRDEVSEEGRRDTAGSETEQTTHDHACE